MIRGQNNEETGKTIIGGRDCRSFEIWRRYGRDMPHWENRRVERVRAQQVVITNIRKGNQRSKEDQEEETDAESKER
jgi:hypothetical protein